MSLEEQLRQNKGNILGRLGGRTGSIGITGKVDMRSRFMDFSKLKRKYGERLGLASSSREQ